MGEDRKEIHVKDFPTATWRRFRSRAALTGMNVNVLLAYVVELWLAEQDETDEAVREAHRP